MEKPGVLTSHGLTHRFFDIPTPDARVHRGIVCDSCEKTVVGSRHKCLDCPDFDLCSTCMTNRLTSIAHNPFHEFLEIHEPGKVIVHTVYSANGEREDRGPERSPSGDAQQDTTRVAAEASPTRATPANVVSSPSSPAVHAATCDLCDSRIIGARHVSNPVMLRDIGLTDVCV